MSEGVTMHEQLNAVEDLMKVAQGVADKNTVYESFKAKYLSHFAKNEELET